MDLPLFCISLTFDNFRAKLLNIAKEVHYTLYGALRGRLLARVRELFVTNRGDCELPQHVKDTPLVITCKHWDVPL